MTTKLSICVHDHKTIGKDKDLGDAEVEVSHLFLYLCLLAYWMTFTFEDLASSEAPRNFLSRHHRRAQTGGCRPPPIRV